MLLRELGRNPHERRGIEAGHVGNELAKVGVIGAFQLVLDQDQPIVAHFTTEDVGPEGPYPRLGPLQLELQPKCCGKQVQVRWARRARA
jgi:hypothetical protein